MNQDTRDEALVRELQGRFRASLETVSELDRARLRRSRRRVLATVDRRRRFGWSTLAAAASLALVALVSLPLVMGPEPDEPEDGPRMAAQDEATAVSDLEILLAGEELGFYAELDFYVWLEAALPREQPDAG